MAQRFHYRRSLAYFKYSGKNQFPATCTLRQAMRTTLPRSVWQKFEFLAFNSAIVQTHCSENKVIAFDPSYIPKSGKKTAGTGYFWSGCSSRALWGLEIGGIAVIDIDNHTALHLEAVQTIGKINQTLLDFYAQTLIKEKRIAENIQNNCSRCLLFKSSFCRCFDKGRFRCCLPFPG